MDWLVYDRQFDERSQREPVHQIEHGQVILQSVILKGHYIFILFTRHTDTRRGEATAYSFHKDLNINSTDSKLFHTGLRGIYRFVTRT